MNKEKSTETHNTPPRKSAVLDMILKVDPDHPLVKKYNEQYQKYLENLNNQVQALEKKSFKPVELPELKPIDIESLYQRFLEAFEFFNNKQFDEKVNDGEGRKLARTILGYLIGKKGSLKSPLINRKVSEPSLDKGLMIIGGKGIGKTSIIRTINDMLFYSRNNPFTVQDIEGTHQLLSRYKIGFSFITANDVVDEYERCTTDFDKSYFHRKYDFGFKYFDDVMSEEVASNFGKRDIFKTIFEKRYSNRAKTMISLNYSEDQDLGKTLSAFGNRYGDRVFDRLFEMFNVIELKGNSLRK